MAKKSVSDPGKKRRVTRRPSVSRTRPTPSLRRETFRLLFVLALAAFATGFVYAGYRPQRPMNARTVRPVIVETSAPRAPRPATGEVSASPTVRPVIAETSSAFTPHQSVPSEPQPAGVQRRRTLPPRKTSGPIERPASIAIHSRVRSTPVDPHGPTPTPMRESPNDAPRVAIIIDDCGNSLEAVRPFLQAACPVTLAILPNLPFSTDIARAAHAAHKGVMLHFPMETVSTRSPLPGTLRVDMTDDQIHDIIRTHFAAVPFLEGVNNHEGSRATADPRLMQTFLKAVSARGLYFVDSFTAPDSCAYATARRMGMRCARRDVFLDNDDHVDAIKEQIRVLMRQAREHGEAVGIGHARPSTATAVVEMVPAFEEASIRLVSARTLARTGSAPAATACRESAGRQR